jgi:hypothetical protein
VKYSPEIIKEICKYVEQGSFHEDAALLAGIAESTFYEWKKKGEFSEALKKAELKCKQRNIQHIQKAAKTTWQAAAWWLERKHQEQFGLKQKIDQTTTQKFDLEDIRALVSPLPPEEQQKFFEVISTALQRGEVSESQGKVQRPRPQQS